MTRLRSVAPPHEDVDDLRARLRFSPETGQIWLHEHRILLVHAEAQALLRKGTDRHPRHGARQGLLMRMGYASGVRDAELARRRAQDTRDIDAFMTGPRLHTLEGIVRVRPVSLELDRAAGKFYGEFLWENSWGWHARLGKRLRNRNPSRDKTRP